MGYELNAPPLQIPDGRFADLEEMLAFGTTLQDFVKQQEALLPEITSEPRHDQIVDFLNELGECYNEQLGIFSNTELGRRRPSPARVSEIELDIAK